MRMLPIIVIIVLLGRTACAEDVLRWKTAATTQGVTIKIPDGFSSKSLSRSASRGGLRITNGTSTAALTYEIFVAPPKNLGRWMDTTFQLSGCTSGRTSANGLLRTYSHRVKGRAYRSVALAHLAGRAATAWLISAPVAVFEYESSRLLPALRGARISDRGEGFATFREASGAFAAAYPVDWSAEGAVTMLSPRLASLQFRAAGDSGSIETLEPFPIFFCLPNRRLESDGYREGDWYEPVPGERMQVRSWRSPDRFFEEFLARRDGRTLRLLARKVVPGLTFTEKSGNVTVTGAAQLLKVSSSDGREGDVLVMTQRFQDSREGVGGWLGFARAALAAPGQSLRRAVAFEQMLATFRVDPSWMRERASPEGAGAVNTLIERYPFRWIIADPRGGIVRASRNALWVQGETPASPVDVSVMGTF